MPQVSGFPAAREDDGIDILQGHGIRCLQSLKHLAIAPAHMPGEADLLGVSVPISLNFDERAFGMVENKVSDRITFAPVRLPGAARGAVSSLLN